MSKKFNTYIDGITPDFWRDLCVNEGQLRHYDRGDEFVTHGEVARFLGYIKSGTFKYIASSSTGEEHVIGLEFTGEFIADFPFSLTGQPSRVSIVAESPADVYCIPVKSVADRLQDDKRLRQIVARSTEAIFATVYDRYIELCTRSPPRPLRRSDHPPSRPVFAILTPRHCIISQYYAHSSQPFTSNYGRQKPSLTFFNGGG